MPLSPARSREHVTDAQRASRVLKLASSGEGTCYKRLIEISLMTTDGYGKLWFRAGPSQLAVPFGDRVQFRPAKWQEISLNDCSRIFLPFQRLAETRCL